MAERFAPFTEAELEFRDPLRGFRWLRRYYSEHADKERESHLHVTPLLRGLRSAMAYSLQQFVESGYVFKWWQMDPSGLSLATDRDEGLGMAVGAFNEITDLVIRSKKPPSDLLLGALVERAAEIEFLGKPHIPRREFRRIEQELGRQESQMMQAAREESLVTSLHAFGRAFLAFLFEQSREGVAKIRDLSEHLPRIPGKDSSTTLFTNPETQKTGESRPTKLPLSGHFSEPILSFELTMNKNLGGRFFAISHIYNAYDEGSGELSTVAKSEPFVTSDGNDVGNVKFAVSASEIANAKTIAIPQLLLMPNWRRVRVLEDTQPQIDSVDIYTSKFKTLGLSSYELDACLSSDALGNVTFNLEKLPVYKRDLLKDGAIIYVRYVEPRQEDKSQWTPLPNLQLAKAKLLAPFSKVERARPQLYPELIAEFADMAQKRIEDSEASEGHSWSRRELLSHLTNFLGDLWLTYRQADAEFSESYPVGFTQTERVLTSRRASCEGANITLLQLARGLLKGEQGLVVVAGYELEYDFGWRFVATSKTAHLQLLYTDASTTRSEALLLDATPLTKKEQGEYWGKFSEARKRMREWQKRIERVRRKLGIKESDEQELTERVHALEERYAKIWNDDQVQPRALIHAFDKTLPGFTICSDSPYLTIAESWSMPLALFLFVRCGATGYDYFSAWSPRDPSPLLAYLSFRPRELSGDEKTWKKKVAVMEKVYEKGHLAASRSYALSTLT